MIDWDKELAEVLKDPVFADVKPTQHRATSSDRLVKSFDEITAFVESNGRKPSADGNMSEKMLYKRLEGIKTDKAKNIFTIACDFMLVAMFILCIVYISSSEYRPNIYFEF